SRRTNCEGPYHLHGRWYSVRVGDIWPHAYNLQFEGLKAAREHEQEVISATNIPTISAVRARQSRQHCLLYVQGVGPMRTRALSNVARGATESAEFLRIYSRSVSTRLRVSD
ncbi:MAG: hypothetical protein MK239_07345, partial [Gemmatimonadetes bacterium]|nr:hypothetical protein [Gemmatimonadota bacterium]